MQIVAVLIRVWWWISVPYSLGMLAVLLVSQQTAGYLIHDLPPLGVIFWVTLRSSMVWAVVVAIMLAMRYIARGAVNLSMLLMAVIVGVAGVMAR